MIKNIISTSKEGNWIRPWNQEKFDDLFNRDERFFAILIKGFLSWINRNIVLYNKPINHFIFNTGSSYLYIESNGYEFSMSETSGEDAIYMKMPRCVIEIGDIAVPQEELSSPYVRGVYERRDGNTIKGYNAQMRRLPIEITLTAKYVLSNFNEAIILIQELIDKLSFQKYFNITYLGQIIQCSLEIDNNYRIEFNKIDMTAPDTNQKNIEINYKLTTNYPCIDERTEIENSHIIESFASNINMFSGEPATSKETTEEKIIQYENDIQKELEETVSIISQEERENKPIIKTESDNFEIIKETPTSLNPSIQNNEEDEQSANIFAYVKHDGLIKTKFTDLNKLY